MNTDHDDKKVEELEKQLNELVEKAKRTMERADEVNAGHRERIGALGDQIDESLGKVEGHLTDLDNVVETAEGELATLEEHSKDYWTINLV